MFRAGSSLKFFLKLLVKKYFKGVCMFGHSETDPLPNNGTYIGWDDVSSPKLFWYMLCFESHTMLVFKHIHNLTVSCFPAETIKCGPNEMFTPCYNDCQLNCKNRIKGYGDNCNVCIQAGCICQPQYYRHDNGSCVLEEDCCKYTIFIKYLLMKP